MSLNRLRKAVPPWERKHRCPSCGQLVGGQPPWATPGGAHRETCHGKQLSPPCRKLRSKRIKAKPGMDMTRSPIPKPEPRKKAKARKARRERAVIQDVRPQVVARDGYCRLMRSLFWPQGIGIVFGACRGASQWAHLGESKRARTRGMLPELRHTTAGSLMLCDYHHDAYDEGRMQIDATTAGADGPLRFERDGQVYQEI